MTDSPQSERLLTKSVLSYLLEPLPPFADSWRMKALEGQARMAFANVAIVGLARNCAGPLRQNLQRAHVIGTGCRSWRLHIETNDNTDSTVAVLDDFCSRNPQASYRDQTLNRQQFGAEFAGPRTIALAEYRTACQQWVRDHAADACYVIVVDFDAWGGWSLDGVRNGFGWLTELPGAYGMATVSLMEHPAAVTDESGVTRLAPSWMHYDAWALRGIGQARNYWDDYTAGFGGWKFQWLPPVGSPPVLVSSAFGGMAIYRTEAYLAGTYDGATDCEHISMHRTMAEANGQHLYLNPSMRTVMRWCDGG
jgi:hypothetical protein